MKITIFYSWQLSTSTKFNKNFIEEAIKKAEKLLNKNKKLPIEEIVIDRDTKDVPGIPSIPETIEGKIRLCDIFIADLTIVTSQKIKTKNKIFKKFLKILFKNFIEPEKLPLCSNPNVLLEFGQAKECISNERMIGVLNSAYGDPHEDDKVIPFDIRHLRWPIKYNLDNSNVSNKNLVLEELSKDIYKAILQIIDGNFERQKTEYYPFLTWKTWDEDLGNKTSYQINNDLQKLKDDLLQEVSSPQKIIRLTGLSGLGKTRFVFECFKTETGNQDSHYLTYDILYCDCNITTENLLKTIKHLINKESRKILILDNCDWETHKKVKELVKGNKSKLTLITMDSDPEYETPGNVCVFKLDKNFFISIISQILKSAYPLLSESDILRIIGFSQGFTLMAVLFAKNATSGYSPSNRENVA